MTEATVGETIAAIKRLRKAGGKESLFSDNEKERACMKRKMDAARVIENKKIDKDD